MRMAAAVLAMLAIAASEARPANYEFTEQLAMLLASEKLCGLTYDAAAIKSYIEANVASDDLGFADSLSGQIALRELGANDIPASQKVARCTQVTRVARALKFIN